MFQAAIGSQAANGPRHNIHMALTVFDCKGIPASRRERNLTAGQRDRDWSPGSANAVNVTPEGITTHWTPSSI
jgi:hypothetical protein